MLPARVSLDALWPGDPMHPSLREILLSGLGGFLAIASVFGLTVTLETAMEARVLLIASMGATAVLLFAAPKSPLAQPWNVIAGHVVSATIGYGVFRVLGGSPVAAGLAVGLAISAMHALDALHPPGGATAAIPVIAGPALGDYGALFVLFPVAFGAILMVLIAVAFNYPLPWRRYPAPLARTEPAAPYPDITHADFVAALSEIDTFVDISEEDLLRIYALATGHHRDAARQDSAQRGKPG